MRTLGLSGTFGEVGQVLEVFAAWEPKEARVQGTCPFTKVQETLLSITRSVFLARAAMIVKLLGRLTDIARWSGWTTPLAT